MFVFSFVGVKGEGGVAYGLGMGAIDYVSAWYMKKTERSLSLWRAYSHYELLWYSESSTKF